MGWVLIAACLWVVASAVVAFLPIRYQIMPGLTLLIVAPVLLYALAVTHGVGMALAGLFAVLSMYRRPLIYLARKMRGALK
ncbi:MAG: DUF2484 family protein [Pseudomonadota bacterium]